MKPKKRYARRSADEYLYSRGGKYYIIAIYDYETKDSLLYLADNMRDLAMQMNIKLGTMRYEMSMLKSKKKKYLPTPKGRGYPYFIEADNQIRNDMGL